MADIKQAVKAFKPTLIVMDSLRRVFGGDENSSQEVAQAARTLDSISACVAGDEPITVCLIHHLTKSARDGGVGASLRGSGDLRAWVRHLVGVEYDEDEGIRTIRVEGNYVQHASPVRLRFEDTETELSVVYDGEGAPAKKRGGRRSLTEQRRAAILDAAAEPQNKNAIARKVKGLKGCGDRKTVLREIDSMAADGELERAGVAGAEVFCAR